MTISKYQISDKELARCIDHTLLGATAAEEQIKQLCEQAKTYEFHTVCVNPRWIPLVAEELAGSKVVVGGVVSLPLGADTTKIKVAQAKEVIFAGADGVIVGSAIVKIIEKNLNDVDKMIKEIKEFVEGIGRNINH